ncbi:MAG TPA: hypothetical protein VG712_00705, partial [Gemmatimonadales bacterium]|nr:hypothetical protein [Gemmatimonadales bacterium]
MTRPLRRAPWSLLLALTVPLQAQTLPAPPDRAAAAARAYWQGAAGALQGGDSLLALARLDSAATVWPVQPAYQRAVARLAARLGSTDRAL